MTTLSAPEQLSIRTVPSSSGEPYRLKRRTKRVFVVSLGCETKTSEPNKSPCAIVSHAFFSSLVGKPVPGRAFFTLSLISTKQWRSFPIQVGQPFRERLPNGSVQIRDLGYFNLEDLARDTADGRWWNNPLCNGFPRAICPRAV
ncbi:hypothetical protein EYB53_021590 [Candidatus Chloroploca sp. M-50]|uniref:Transposase IS4-like domain-containing protein n=1 Tax=Candidatus Chloroploca mongolica TaxID=2528176 RepID=A0ABS4DFU1_9CHLR|nr:hypothetical protein [Candidatus Chloroploca mongolica]MBP1468319.1 hypothetical protein [Candidatus Chloroploca mongolica]